MWKKIQEFHSTKPEYAFLIRLAIAYALLEGTHQYLRTVPEGIQLLNFLTYFVSYHTGLLVELWGKQFEMFAQSYGEDIFKIGYMTVVDGRNSVYVAYDCNGMELLVAFLAFLFAFNFTWNKHLFWFIPLGLALIHFINVFRVLGLMIIYEINPNWLEINHKYIFTIVVYGLILLLLYWWVQKFSKFKLFKWNG